MPRALLPERVASEVRGHAGEEAVHCAATMNPSPVMNAHLPARDERNSPRRIGERDGFETHWAPCPPLVSKHLAPAHAVAEKRYIPPPSAVTIASSGAACGFFTSSLIRMSVGVTSLP
jgi:hypothetical protein